MLALPPWDVGREGSYGYNLTEREIEREVILTVLKEQYFYGLLENMFHLIFKELCTLDPFALQGNFGLRMDKNIIRK